MSPSNYIKQEEPQTPENCSFDPLILQYLQPFSKYMKLIELTQENILREIEIRSKQEKHLSATSTRKVIIFDMDETLLHYSHEANRVFVRPFCDSMILQLSAYFDLWIWTCAQKEYADLLLDTYIDPENKFFKHRFYRDSCIKVTESLYVKDIRIFKGISAANVIIVENQLMSFSSCLSNGYLCDTYTDAADDQELLNITNFMLAIKDEEDFRVPLCDSFQFQKCFEFLDKKK